MNDTSPEVLKKMQEIMMSKTGEEKLLMRFSMFSFARQIAKASILEEFGEQASPQLIKRELFLRFYKQDLDNDEIERIINLFKACNQFTYNLSYS